VAVNGCVTTGRRLIGYALCSTDPADALEQTDALADLGVDGHRIYLDMGLVGTDRARPGLQDALTACRSGDTLIVTKLDRLAGSVASAKDITRKLKNHGVILSVGGRASDPTEPAGAALFDALTMVAEFEVEVTRRRTREWMDLARAEGRLNTRQPKLSASDERRLVELRRSEKCSVAELGSRFGVSRATVYRALDRVRAGEGRAPDGDAVSSSGSSAAGGRRP
jgi:DNA invertase Pin-like site-specific DNA recombinase